MTEHLFRGATAMQADAIALRLEDDRSGAGVLAPVTDTPTRLVLTLAPMRGGTSLVVDSAAEGYSLGAPGGGTDTFQWTAATGRLVIFVGSQPLTAFPAGAYAGHLLWIDADHPDGLRYPNGAAGGPMSFSVQIV